MPRVLQRTTVMAMCIALPAVAASVGLPALEAYRIVVPDAALFGDPPARSLAEAITHGRGVEAAYPFIRAGQDPNASIVIDDEDYTDGAPMSVSPLIVAIASRDSNIVQMLVNFGARLDVPQNRDAWCFARALGHETIQNVLAAAGADTDPGRCPQREWDRSRPPLAWFH